jgi:hypothetical protein
MAPSCKPNSETGAPFCQCSCTASLRLFDAAARACGCRPGSETGAPFCLSSCRHSTSRLKYRAWMWPPDTSQNLRQGPLSSGAAAAALNLYKRLVMASGCQPGSETGAPSCHLSCCPGYGLCTLPAGALARPLGATAAQPAAQAEPSPVSACPPAASCPRLQVPNTIQTIRVRPKSCNACAINLAALHQMLHLWTLPRHDVSIQKSWHTMSVECATCSINCNNGRITVA